MNTIITWSDDDCEDQGMGATKTCTRCRTGFTDAGEPIYAPLELRGRYWCCVECGNSYGENPHPDCPPAAIPSAKTLPGI